ncbi:MAG: mevalonate kinase [bacterium]
MKNYKSKIVILAFFILLITTYKGYINKNNLTAYGCGKIILFNEHFVVYDTPAIAASLPQKVIARIINSDEFNLYPKILETGDTLKAINKIFECLNLKKENCNFCICFESEIEPGSGIGSSAAFAVATIKVLSKYLKLNLRNTEINKIAYETEKIFHQNPSGIDNTISTYQGIIFFKKENPVIIKQLNIKETLIFVVGKSGKIGLTKKAVKKVKKFKDKNPEKFETILQKAIRLADKSLNALINSDVEKIGKFMNKNHKLLQQIKVSTPDLDQLINIAKQSGATGAKLTGGGLGGNMIALVKNEEDANKILDGFKKKGFDGFVVKIKNSNYCK